jgi:hypothetical protein
MLAPETSPGQPEDTYDLFIREAGAPIAWKNADHGVRLNGRRIGWSARARNAERPLSDITAIHLTTEVHSPTTTLGASVCRISFKNGDALSVLSTNSRGFDDAGFAVRYRTFVNDLHARLSPEERASIVFSAGRGGVMYGLALIATVLLGIGVAAIVVFAMMVDGFKLRMPGAVAMGAGLVLATVRHLRANAPHAYDPARPLESAADGSITATVNHAVQEFRHGLTPGKSAAYGAVVLLMVGVVIVIVGSHGTVTMFGPGRARHALEVIQQSAYGPLTVKNVEITPQMMTVVVPDPRGDSAPTVWTARRRSLFGWTDWDDVTGPTVRYDDSALDDSLQDPFKVVPDDMARLDELADAAIARAALGDGSAVTDMILTQAPQFTHPEQPRWTVRVAGPSRSVEIIADRGGTLFPAPAPRVGAPRIVIRLAPADTMAARMWNPSGTNGAWIRVRDTDQSVLFDGVLHAGDKYEVPNAPGLSLRTGLAGALAITVDGKTVPPIGYYSDRRDVRLDPEALLAGTAVEP